VLQEEEEEEEEEEESIKKDPTVYIFLNLCI
jgi:hypothetical protein